MTNIQKETILPIVYQELWHFGLKIHLAYQVNDVNLV